MNQRKTISVRLTKANKWPHHGVNPRREGEGWPGWRKWRGKSIQIFSKHVKPDWSWACDTKRIWEVTMETCEKIVPAEALERAQATGKKFYVCEHQIQAAKHR